MGTLLGGYYTKDGKRVPSVTTVLSNCALGGCDGLVAWAADLAKEGIDWRSARDSAADAGTMGHTAFEAWSKGQPVSFNGPEEIVAKAKQSFDAFLEWVDQVKFQIVQTELPLVSETYRYGGTFDCILMNGKRVMGDYKTSNSVQPKMLIQLSAYAKLWEEHYPDQPIDGGFVLLRFDKTYGDFSHRWWPELDSAWRGFLHMRELYEINKELTKRTK